MQTSNIKQSIVVVTGMHRSGTSFTASLLQNAGLDIGQRLIGPRKDNVKGFFESVEFVEFHEMVLRSQGLHHVGWTSQKKIEVEAQYVEKAKEIISKNSQNQIWGWKDPRTTLFLDFWINLLPDANFLLIYRSPWEVVDSLYRRGDELFLAQPELAVKMWMHYNQQLLNFYDNFSGRCFLVSVYSIANKTEYFIKAINEKFKVNLNTPDKNIFEKSLFHTEVSDVHRSSLIGHYFPDALDIYQELNKREVLLSDDPDGTWLEQIKPSPDGAWAFQDWQKVRNLQRQVKSLRSQLERSQSQLQQIQTALQSLSSIANIDYSEED